MQLPDFQDMALGHTNTIVLLADELAVFNTLLLRLTFLQLWPVTLSQLKNTSSNILHSSDGQGRPWSH